MRAADQLQGGSEDLIGGTPAVSSKETRRGDNRKTTGPQEYKATNTQSYFLPSCR